MADFPCYVTLSFGAAIEIDIEARPGGAVVTLATDHTALETTLVTADAADGLARLLAKVCEATTDEYHRSVGPIIAAHNRLVELHMGELHEALRSSASQLESSMSKATATPQGRAVVDGLRATADLVAQIIEAAR